MKLLIAAVLLAVMQGLPPVPRKATDNAAHSSRAINQQTAGQQTQPQSPLLVQNETHPKTDQEKSASPSNADTKKAVIVGESTAVPIKDWWDRSYIIFSGLLVVIGAAGVIAAVCTLKTIAAQVRIMRHQGAILLRQTKATVQAARAAKESVSIAISSSRAWLLVEDVQIPFESLRALEAGTTASNPDAQYFTVRLRNYGDSPAFIYAAEMRYSYGGLRDMPTYPGIYHQGFIAAPTQHIVPPFVNSKEVLTDCWIGSCHLEGPLSWLTTQLFGEIRNSQMFLWAQGVVRYRDVHEREHETRFCYRYEVPPRVPAGHEHFCVAGPGEYNKAS
ncbi:MAG TPA: hypothetical protein VMF91_05155 [Bryobacteraceae bacterium]|nr:hypothetical protein [Bryobacteraceae bacterium]